MCDVFSEINPIFFLFRDFQDRDVEDITHTPYTTRQRIERIYSLKIEYLLSVVNSKIFRTRRTHVGSTYKNVKLIRTGSYFLFFKMMWFKTFNFKIQSLLPNRIFKYSYTRIILARGFFVTKKTNNLSLSLFLYSLLHL